VVDPEQRRQDVVAAVCRVILRDGLDRASVRQVAAEAELSMGSLRHYFATQADLMAFTLRAVIAGVDKRISALPDSPDPLSRAVLVLAELLPLDEERLTEHRIWLAFTARAMVDPDLAALCDEGRTALRDGCRSLLEPLTTGNLDRETDRLHALVDGLAIHAALHPESYPPHYLHEILHTHMSTLPEV